MAKHEVLSPVEHDGALYGEGSMITLSDDAASALLAAGVLKVVEAVASEVKKARSGEG